MSERTCVVSDCERPGLTHRRGLCGMHYQREWKADKRCSIPACTNTYLAKGMSNRQDLWMKIF